MAERVEQPPANHGADDPQHEVEHQSLAADFANEIEFGSELLNPHSHLTAALGLISLGGHAQMVRPLVAPMAEGAAENQFGPLPRKTRFRIRAHSAAADNIAVFFGVLLVGFAYLWKRGDIDWVRALAAERAAEPAQPPPIIVKPGPAPSMAGTH